MGLALYRKYRSKSLDEIVGQSHITDLLRRSLESDNVAHAYLLTGPRGVGKTSIARILAHEINKLPYDDESTHLDIIEIDAASNNSVEDIRDLRERVQIAPTSAPKKVYIIDEVHMLSKSAFNALLKTLEEPPEHVVFILATTDVDKLPATIVSRTQRFNFRAIGVEDAVEHLTDIAKKEHIAVEKDALRLIAIHSVGSFRDSISMLDQLQHTAGGKITVEAVEQMMGLAPQGTIDALLAAYRTQDVKTIVDTLNRYEQQGTPASTLVRQLVGTINQLIVGEPQLLTLLDTLLDTSRSAWPYVKLMTALAIPQHTATPPALTSEPTSAPAKPIIKKRTEVAVPEETPSIDPAGPSIEVPEPAAVPSAIETPVEQPLATDLSFDWEGFITRIKAKASGMYTVLQKSSHTFDGTTLTIYAGRKFNKTQLDKSHALLVGTLVLLAPSASEVVVLPSSKAPENSQTAAILDMMGGGEEVTV